MADYEDIVDAARKFTSIDRKTRYVYRNIAKNSYSYTVNKNTTNDKIELVETIVYEKSA